MFFGGFQGQTAFLQLAPDTQAVAVLPPGPCPQVFQCCFAAGVRGAAGVRLLQRRLGEAQHLVEIGVALRMAGCEELLHSVRGGLSEASRGKRRGLTYRTLSWLARLRREELARNGRRRSKSRCVVIG